MKFIVDNMLSPELAEKLNIAGQDAVHVRDVGLGTAEDDAIFDRAIRDRRVILSADRDFGAIHAERRTAMPSVIFIKGGIPRRPDQLAPLLLANLEKIAEPLQSGGIVVIEPGRIRVRDLPIAGG